MNFQEFLRTYSGGDSRGTTLDGIAGQVLHSVRASLVANEKQVRDFHATEGTESTLWKKGTTTNVSNPIRERRIDEYTMYKSIVEDAVFHPLVGRELIQSIMYGSGSKPPNPPCLATSKSRPIGSSSLVTPTTTTIDYYTQIHYPIHGKMPGHYMDNLNAPKTQYRGTNIQDAIDAFHLFSGRAVIGCGTCGKKRQRRQRNYDVDEMESQVLPPVPPLVPIATHIYEPPSGTDENRIDDLLIFSDDENESIRTRIDASAMPALVPIDHRYGLQTKNIDSNLPPLVPIARVSSSIPPLVPLSSAIPNRVPSINDFL
jgi:hypothetical protein